MDPISDFDSMAARVINTTKECVNTQLGAVDSSITALNQTMTKLFKQLEDFKDRAAKCHSANVNAKNLVIIRCLKPVSEIYISNEIKKRCRFPHVTMPVISVF